MDILFIHSSINRHWVRTMFWVIMNNALAYGEWGIVTISFTRHSIVSPWYNFQRYFFIKQVAQIIFLMKRNMCCVDFPVYLLPCHWLQAFRLSFICWGFSKWLTCDSDQWLILLWRRWKLGKKKLTHASSWSESWRQTPPVISHLLYLDFYDSTQFYFALSYLYIHMYMCLYVVLLTYIYIYLYRVYFL